MNLPVQRLCAYCGYPFLGLFLIGFWFIAGFVPPPDPSDTPQEVARMFQEDATQIRIGMIVATFGAVLTLPWQATIAVQMRRIEGRHSPLTLVWIMCAALFCIEFVYPLMFWMVTAFRPEGDPEVLQRFHDLSWISLLGVVGTAIMQAVALGIVILRDGRDRPVYPRWFGYTSLWAALLFFPAGLIIFFKDGAFAWNGFISWWLVLSVFALWIIVLTALTVKAVASHGEEGDDDLASQVAALRAEVAELRRSGVPSS